jgi:hypothetical protein
MSLLVECECGRKLKAAKHLSGRKVRCPACGAISRLMPVPVLDVVMFTTSPAPVSPPPSVAPAASSNIPVPIPAASSPPPDPWAAAARLGGELNAKLRPLVAVAATHGWRLARTSASTGWRLTCRSQERLRTLLETNLPAQARPWAGTLTRLSLVLLCLCGLRATSSLLGSVFGSGEDPAIKLADDRDPGPAPDFAPAAPESAATDGNESHSVAAASISSGRERHWWDEEPEPEVDPRVHQLEAAIGLFALFAGDDFGGGGGGYSRHDSSWDQDMAEQRRRDAEYASRSSSTYDSSPSMFQSSPVWDGAYAPSPGWNEASLVWQGAYAP